MSTPAPVFRMTDAELEAIADDPDDPRCDEALSELGLRDECHRDTRAAQGLGCAVGEGPA